MAEIRIRQTNERITDEQQVHAFLEKQNILYEHWDIKKMPEELRENFSLTDEQKQQILEVFQDEIQDLAARRGYRTWDVITLSEQTPNLDELLKKFEAIHTHTEDEIRAIVGGKGIFIIKGSDDVGYFDVELSAGDLISVPENKPHFFTLMDNKKIIAVRLFIETDGWIAYPYDDPSFTSS